MESRVLSTGEWDKKKKIETWLQMRIKWVDVGGPLLCQGYRKHDYPWEGTASGLKRSRQVRMKWESEWFR